MIRHTIKASHLALGLSVVGIMAFSTAAFAQTAEPEMSFHPASKWTVSSKAIEVASAQVQNCNISGEFNNGFILGLNGSHKWVQNLSLDLRQAALEQGKSYDVTLSVPGLSKTTVPGIASRANLLVVDMDGQKSLYQTMRDSAVLDLAIEDNSFRFYMTNFTGPAKQFERCMAGGDIHPATSGDTQLEASASENPYAKFTSNESIALEEQEVKRAATTEINPDDPKPVAQRIPYKETKKVGDHIVGESAVSADGSEDITESSIATPPVVEAIPAAPETDVDVIADRRSLAENAVENATPKPRQRLTEMLQNEIEENPDIATIEDGRAPAPPPSVEETMPMMDDDIQADITAEITEAAPAPKPAILAAPVEAPTPAPEPAPKAAASKSLVIPPVMDKIPLDSAEAPAPDIEIPALPKPTIENETDAAATINENPATTAEDLNRQQLEKIAARTTASTSTAAMQANAPEEERIMFEEDNLSAPAMEQDITEDVAASASGEAPFGQSLERVTALSDPSVKNNIEVEVIKPDEEAPAAKMAAMDASKSDSILLPADEASVETIEVPEVKTTRMRTPNVITEHKIERMEADFTNLDSMEPASANDASSYRDPEFGRKVSQLENMINKLEQENKALKSELEATLEDSKQERMNISSDNWNLERATMKFNEAERQVKVLGQQLQRERTQCTMEKKELETMLFDPEVTDQKQMARLADLERKLQKCESGS